MLHLFRHYLAQSNGSTKIFLHFKRKNISVVKEKAKQPSASLNKTNLVR